MKLTKVLKKADDYIHYKAAIEYMEGAKHIIVHEGHPTKYPCLVNSELDVDASVPCYKHRFIYPEDLKDLEEWNDVFEEEDLDDLIKASIESKIKGFGEEPPKLSLVKPPLCSQGRCVEDGTFWCTRMNAFFCDYDRHYASCCALVPEAPPMCEHGCKNRFQYWRCKATNAIYCILHYHAGVCCQPIETPKSRVIVSASEGWKRTCEYGCTLNYGYYWCSKEARRFCSKHAHIAGSCCTWTVMSGSSGTELRPVRPKIEGVHCQEGCQNDVDHFCTQLLEYRCSIHCHVDKCCRYIYGSQAASGAVKVVDHRDGAEPEAAPEPEVQDPREVKFVEESDDAKAK